MPCGHVFLFKLGNTYIKHYTYLNVFAYIQAPLPPMQKQVTSQLFVPLTIIFPLRALAAIKLDGALPLPMEGVRLIPSLH